MKPVNCSSRAGSTRVRVLAFCLAVLTVMMTCTVVIPVSAEDSYPANYTNVTTDDNGVRYAYDTDAEIWLAVGLDDDCNLHAVVAASTPDGYPEEFTYPETVEKLDDSSLTLTESGNKIMIDVDVDALDFEHYIYYLSLEVLDYNDIVYVKQANTEYLLNETQYTGLLTDGLIQVTADFTGTDIDMTIADYDHLLVTLYATRTVDYETHIYGMAWDSLGYVGSESFDFPTTIERLSDGFLTMSQPAGGSVILIVPDFSKFDFEHYDYYYKAFGYSTSELASVCAELEECIGSGIGAYVIDTGDFYALTLNTTVFASSAESADENQILALVIGVAKDLTGVCEAYQLGWNSREYYNPAWEIESETETESATEPETEPVIEHPETEYRFYHGETVVTVEPDCTNPGTSMTPLYRDTVDKVTGEVYSTYFCGYTYELIPALGHDYTFSILDGPLSCTKDTPYHYSCSRCEEIFYDTIPAPGHTLSDWEPYVDATYTSTGVERRHCMYCDYSEDRIVPMLSMPSFSLGINGRILTRGATFTVPVTLKTNPGVITTKFSVIYPSAFTLEKVEDAELLKGFIQPSPDVHSPYTLLWKDSLSTTNNTATGTVVFLTFKVKDDAAIGEYEFAIIPAEARNAAGAAITLNNIYETVTVSDAIIGDTDGDGEVSDWDGVILDRYLAGWDIGDIDMTAFDIDGDGEVTDWDGVLMDRWLAGWDVECNIIGQ